MYVYICIYRCMYNMYEEDENFEFIEIYKNKNKEIIIII